MISIPVATSQHGIVEITIEPTAPNTSERLRSSSNEEVSNIKQLPIGLVLMGPFKNKQY